MLARYKDILAVEGIRRLLNADETGLSEKRIALSERLSSHFGSDSVFLFSSRRAALSVLIRALGIGVGDEVIIPALTDPAIADTVLAIKSIPHLADIEPTRMAMKPSSLRRILARGHSRLVVDMPLGGTAYRGEAASGIAAGFNVPFAVDLSQSWPVSSDVRPIAPGAVALVISFGSGHPLVSAGGGALLVRDPDVAKKVDGLIVDLPRVGRDEDEMALKGLLIQNRLLSSDIYDGSEAPSDSGYQYAKKMGNALYIGSLFEDDYLKVAAQEALAESADLAAPPRTNIMRRFHRWLHPGTAVPAVEIETMGDLSAAIAELHIDRVLSDGERRARIVRLYHSELVRLDQVDSVEPADETGGDSWMLHYPIMLGLSVPRSRAIRRCRDAGFEVGPFYYPRPLSGLFPYYKLCRHTAKYLRGAWRVASSLLNLPLHQEIDDLQAARLVRALKGQ